MVLILLEVVSKEGESADLEELCDLTMHRAECLPQTHSWVLLDCTWATLLSA
jgi:hypothetical protein